MKSLNTYSKQLRRIKSKLASLPFGSKRFKKVLKRYNNLKFEFSELVNDIKAWQPQTK